MVFGDQTNQREAVLRLFYYQSVSDPQIYRSLPISVVSVRVGTPVVARSSLAERLFRWAFDGSRGFEGLVIDLRCKRCLIR